MNSIHRNLSFGLLSGLTVLWLIAGTGVYISVKRSLLKSIDAEIAVDASAIRFSGRGVSSEAKPALTNPRYGVQRIKERAPQYFLETGHSFFQIWDSQGEQLEKSKSLGEMSFDYPDVRSGTPRFYSGLLPDGRAVRMMAYRSTSGGKGKGRRESRTIILGKETTDMTRALSSVLGGIILTGVLAGGCAIGLVQWVLKKGLKPLENLSEHVAEVDVFTSSIRFENSNATKELVPIYNRLNELMSRVSAGFEREKQFSSNLAHEMRTPISELKMITEIALKWPDQQGEKTYLETLDIAHHLERMIESLLMLGRVESGEIQINLKSIDLPAFISKSWQIWAEKAKDHIVEFEHNDETPWTADPDLLQHCLRNLFANAVEYTEPGGEIRITTQGNRLEISNPAPHLKEADIGHLFDRLWRADQSRSDSNHAGIGLSLARECARAQNMQLSASLNDGTLIFSLVDQMSSSLHHN